MKPRYNLATLILLTATLLAGAGCASTTPTALERKFFDVETNLVQRISVATVTNQVTITNQVVEVKHVTNQVNQVETVTVTNLVTVPVPQVELVKITNWVEAYHLTPNTNSVAAAEIGRGVGNFFGVGGVVGVIISGLFAGWAGVRNRRLAGRADQWEATGEVLAQGIETLRQVLKDTPQGKDLDAVLVKWLQDHQREAGVFEDVLALLDRSVDNQQAREIAARIRALVAERATKV